MVDMYMADRRRQDWFGLRLKLLSVLIMPVVWQPVLLTEQQKQNIPAG